MANIITNNFKEKLMEGAYNLTTDTVKVALLTSSESPAAEDETFSNTNEVSGTGYTAGGATLTNPTVTQDDTDDEGVYDADDVTWSSSTITARYAVIYNTTVADDIMAYIDFTEDKSSSSSDFKIEWNAEGIINLS